MNPAVSNIYTKPNCKPVSKTHLKFINPIFAYAVEINKQLIINAERTVIH